jgi:hypothetical protein
MEFEISFTPLQKFATRQDPKTDKISLHPTNRFFKIYLNIILPWH